LEPAIDPATPWPRIPVVWAPPSRKVKRDAPPSSFRVGRPVTWAESGRANRPRAWLRVRPRVGAPCVHGESLRFRQANRSISAWRWRAGLESLRLPARWRGLLPARNKSQGKRCGRFTALCLCATEDFGRALVLVTGASRLTLFLSLKFDC
jgi:hypothetical protein